jgi:hypothetical protein
MLKVKLKGKMKSNAGETKYMLHFIYIRNLPDKNLLAQFRSLFMKLRLMCTFAVTGNAGSGQNTFGKKKFGFVSRKRFRVTDGHVF